MILQVIQPTFLTYLSQMALIAGGFGFFIKFIIDRRSKSFEIKHKLFQENRLEAILNFYSSYSEWQKLILDFTINVGHKQLHTEKDLQNMHGSKYGAFAFSITTLNFYLEAGESELVHEIMTNFDDAHLLLLDLLSEPFEEERKQEYKDKADLLIEEKIIVNDKVMLDFQRIVHDSYNKRTWL